MSAWNKKIELMLAAALAFAAVAPGLNCSFDPAGSGLESTDARPGPVDAAPDSDGPSIDAATHDAMVIDAMVIDATPIDAMPPGTDDIPCGTLTCGYNCCVLDPGPIHMCDVLHCIGASYDCNDQGDCANGEDCCTDGTDTFCAPEGSCTREVCDNTSEQCTNGNHDGCGTMGGDPFPTCFED